MPNLAKTWRNSSSITAAAPADIAQRSANVATLATISLNNLLDGTFLENLGDTVIPALYSEALKWFVFDVVCDDTTGEHPATLFLYLAAEFATAYTAHDRIEKTVQAGPGR